MYDDIMMMMIRVTELHRERESRHYNVATSLSHRIV